MATVIHHGVLRSSGIATTADGTKVLAIAGSYWLDAGDDRLATPEQALERLLAGGIPEGPAFSGDYSYVLYDTASRRVTAECGGFGAVPLYFAANGSGLTVSTDLKLLLPLIEPRLSRDGVSELLLFGHLFSDVTLLEGVRRVLPAGRVVALDGAVRTVSFPRPIFERDRTPTPDLLDRLDEQFERAIARYSTDAPRVSVSLSGGIDSRTTLLAAREAGVDVAAWTAGEAGSRECAVAQRVCDRLGVPLTVHANDPDRLPGWFDRAIWFTEARCPPGHIHFLDAAFAGVLGRGPQLHGLVGDVVAGGDYDTMEDVPTDPDALRRFCAKFMQSIVYWPEGAWEQLGFGAWVAPETRARAVATVLSRCPDQDPYSFFLWSRYQHRGVGFIVPALVSQVAPWADVITPFIDPAFFATCATISREAIYDRKTQIAWAARRYPELLAIPRVKDGVLLPLGDGVANEYNRRIKRLQRVMQFRYYLSRVTGGRLNLASRESYPSYATWYRRSAAVRAFFHARLLSPQSLARGIWTREGLERLLHDLRIGRNVWDALGTILTVETFARLFVDGSADEVGYSG